MYWRCAGCGAPYPDRVGNCECATTVIYREDGKKMVHETKLMSRTKIYDSLCRDFAEAILEEESYLNTEERRSTLTLFIRSAIADFIECERDNYEPPDPPGWEGGFADNH